MIFTMRIHLSNRFGQRNRNITRILQFFQDLVAFGLKVQLDSDKKKEKRTIKLENLVENSNFKKFDNFQTRQKR
jgi:hypothetical protein